MDGAWIIDANNVIGSRSDGWWRDRPGALARLVDQVVRWQPLVSEAVLIVVDGAPSDRVPEGSFGGVEVRYSHTKGRDAADDEIVRMVSAATAPTAMRVVTSDRALRARIAALGATVEGAGQFLDRLGRMGGP